jgi:GYF domain 2
MPQYWINTGNKTHGPFDASQLKKLALKGELKRDHKVSADQKRWTTAESVKGLEFQPELAQVSPLNNLFDEEFAYPTTDNVGSPTLLEGDVQSLENSSADTKPLLATSGLHRASDLNQKLERATGKWLCKINDQILGPLDIKKVCELAAVGHSSKPTWSEDLNNPLG